MDDFSRRFCVEAASPCEAELRVRRDCYRVARVRLIDCQDFHTQYDVTNVAELHVNCRCGSEVENPAYEAVEARVYSCGSCGAKVELSDTHCEYCGSQIVRDKASLHK